MPTQEERLETVEYGLKQFKTETIKAYLEMAMEVTMVKGLSEDSVKRLITMKSQIDQRFDTLNQQMTDVKEDIVDLQIKFDQMNHQMSDAKRDIVDLHVKFDGLSDKFDLQRELLLQVLARLPEKS